MAVSKGITRILGNVAVLFASLAFSIFIAESLARVVVDPVDYLNPTVVPDEYLGHRIEGNTGGHDAWGFRNSRVPEIADIVCIGDSQTYGVAARASESWPAVLGKIRNQSVYNLALGGYGPIQYLHLMRTYAVRLKPKMVIVGLYFGNDMMDAYNMVRFNKNWRAYETLEGPEIAAPRLVSQYSPKFLRGLRVWLAGHSLLYAMEEVSRLLIRSEGERPPASCQSITRSTAMTNTTHCSILKNKSASSTCAIVVSRRE